MAVSPMCYCGAEETLVHLFIHCLFAKDMLKWFYSILNRVNASIIDLSHTEVLARHRRLPVGLNALLGIIRHRIWVVRNFATLDSIPPNISKVKPSFRFLLLVQYKNTKEDYFRSNWLCGSTFGNIDGNNKLLHSNIISD